MGLEEYVAVLKKDGRTKSIKVFKDKSFNDLKNKIILDKGYRRFIISVASITIPMLPMIILIFIDRMSVDSFREAFESVTDLMFNDSVCKAKSFSELCDNATKISCALSIYAAIILGIIQACKNLKNNPADEKKLLLEKIENILS